VTVIAAQDFDTVALGGTTVRVDPQTGRLLEPTSEEVRQLRATLQRIFAPARAEGDAVVHTDGTKTLILDESYSVFSIAQVAGDGRISTHCVMGAAQAEAALEGRTTHSGNGEE
jgi:hypothetical protein